MLAPIFLTIASNLLREYSFQDPHDLRIRRRKTPLPKTSFVEAFLSEANLKLSHIDVARSYLGNNLPIGEAILGNAGTLTAQDVPVYFDAAITSPPYATALPYIDTQRLSIDVARSYLGNNLPIGEAILGNAGTLTAQDVPVYFDAAITSPPYATALPYIDTQRLSLVWLELLDSGHIRELEANLIGSREIRGNDRSKSQEALETNAAKLPDQEAEFCTTLQQAIGQKDGFRRKAVPLLLYRYFASMRDCLTAIRRVMNPGAPFGLIVGHNHTILGGVRYDINTPVHLVSLAESAGWHPEETLQLQAYQRYGYHMNNAISAESLIILWR